MSPLNMHEVNSEAAASTLPTYEPQKITSSIQISNVVEKESEDAKSPISSHESRKNAASVKTSLITEDNSYEATNSLIYPKILSIQDLDAIIEARDPKTATVSYTTFYVFNSVDIVFFGQFQRQRSQPKSSPALWNPSPTTAFSLFFPKTPN